MSEAIVVALDEESRDSSARARELLARREHDSPSRESRESRESRQSKGSKEKPERVRRASSNLRLHHTEVNDIGTMEEVRMHAASARKELEAFAATTAPKRTKFRAFKFGVCVINVRHFVEFLPFIMHPFTRQVVHVGGLERLYILLTIARFDLNGDGKIDIAEYELSRIQAEKCVNNAVTGCANFAIISALLFGATHLTTIGRPKPFAPDPASVDAYGEEPTTIVIWVAYSLNVCAQSLALGIIITSIYARQLLCNTLPSVMSKMVFLSETNLLSNMGTACTWMIASLVWVVVLGGFLSVPTYGFISCAIVPILALILIPAIYPAFLSSAVRLHMETYNVLFPRASSSVDAEMDSMNTDASAGPADDDMVDADSGM